MGALVQVTGCGQQVWSKPGATISEFNNHNNQCQMVAGSATPTVYVPPSPTYTHSGTVTTPSGSGYYRGTSTPSPNFSGIGSALGTAWARSGIIEDCMISNGYTKSQGNDDLVQCDLGYGVIIETDKASCAVQGKEVQP